MKVLRSALYILKRNYPKTIGYLFLMISLFLFGIGEANASDRPHALSMQMTGSNHMERGSGQSKTFRYHPSRLLVRFTTGKPSFLPDSGAATNVDGVSGLFIVHKPAGLSMPETIRRYKANSKVLYAEPDYMVSIANTIPSDPLWNQQWDMVKIGAPAAWDKQTGASDVVVAVIDTGIDYNHPDLQDNLWTNGNSHGFSCFGSVRSGGADDQGHGTHVAGTIGAVANNGVGVAGINWTVQLLSLKFLDSSGSGYISDAILCFNKAISLKQGGVNIRVTNNSWGGGPFTQSLKDVMSGTEAADILNVCAAGNNGLNADVYPMYPAAFDNRGIVSVLASDQNDSAAAFSNYGLASVDIAAPGVNILSTEVSGKCALCDPSGYRYLSGTSMAAPHVAGVLAGLFHRSPGLTVYEARDLILDSASYDSVKNTKAKTTTTGGRLNFAKAVNNPMLFSPRLNGFPILNKPEDIHASAGSRITLSVSASDPDADAIRSSWAKNIGSGNWLIGSMLDILFPNANGNPYSFNAPSLARAVTVPYIASVADNRGGSAQDQTLITVLENAAHGQPPAASSFSVTPTSGPVGTTITINYPVSDPENGAVLWDLGMSYPYGWTDYCCFSGSSTTKKLNTAGAYRIRAQAMDRELNVSQRSSTVVRIGGASGEPPLADAIVDRNSGPAPLTVRYDASSSYDPDGNIQQYVVYCNGPGSIAQQTVTGACTYNTPGAYAMNLAIRDNQGLVDNIWIYITVTSGGGSGGDTTPPTVTLTAPLGGATVSRNSRVALAAAASDDVGVTKVEFYVNSKLTCTDSSDPYNCVWKVPAKAGVIYTIQAKSYDAQGNHSWSNTVSVTAK